ncbi:MAG: hypothetical protein ACTHLR_13405, partial [Rhizomicrobium sp.]
LLAARIGLGKTFHDKDEFGAGHGHSPWKVREGGLVAVEAGRRQKQKAGHGDRPVLRPKEAIRS